MQQRKFYVGNYEVIRHIANGAFGCVYLARPSYRGQQDVALKLLNGKRSQSEYERDRFMREAHVLKALHHRGIPRLFDSGITSEGVSYIALEYAPNGNLRDLIKCYPNGVMPYRQALAILDGIAEVLSYVHAQGFLHHDIKPENVLFKDNWEPMLADFGIALLQEEVTVRRLTALVGTPAYMAPEQYRYYASRRSDQYSLAVLAYELFTGQLPFEADTRTGLQEQHAYARPLPPSTYNQGLPPFIDRAILKALEKRRVDRFDSVRSFMNALHGATMAARRVPAAVPVFRSNMRR